MSGWWFSARHLGERSTNAIASGTSELELPLELRRSGQSTPSMHGCGRDVELLCEHVFRPVAHLSCRARAARLPPRRRARAARPAARQPGSAAALVRRLLLQLKTVLDNADGQLARPPGGCPALGRYLDSESDLLVNAALFAALGT